MSACGGSNFDDGCLVVVPAYALYHCICRFIKRPSAWAIFFAYELVSIPLQKVYTLVSKQQQITQYLGAGTQKIDDMIKTAKQAIALPYKNTAPPYSPLAVTGKIDVWGFRSYGG
ncbi:MAG: hypothetical protein CTY16_20135 [Methylobacter sp.]|nr:MAG: hypothetical protein CTY16_20135 [Methylobacter sp.]